MGKHTVVIEFAGEEPAYSANMELLGGRVVAVAFADEMERAEALESQRDGLLSSLEEAIDMIGERLIKDTFGYEWYEEATAAIDKARGEA